MDQEVIKQNVNKWYEKYSNDIYQYIFFMIGDHEMAKDLVHDTFLRSYSNYLSFRGGNEKGWLFRIARNITIDFIRKKKPISYLMNTDMQVKANELLPENVVTINESEKELYAALTRLKRSYRDVIILRKLKDFSIQETADILGWNESKVKSTLFRGLKELKKELVKEGYQHEKLSRNG
ncbi:RNA polymerase sigma-70 factor [Bacillus oleivorans]|uniref:RNA polymerase sigma-70 factor n=1 Tax=Bacillus oleivorans TaxID=1448271 RepID=A0A285CLX1_9BACI|nr:RNA polymerase sigma factor [Bacillus oleivorans]SNX68537.1 RNA polymerase sigma-70 factor [Bacillus oleivorans]